MNRNFKLFTTSLIVSLALAALQLIYGTESAQCSFDILDEGATGIIVKHAVVMEAIDGKNHNLARVCARWNKILKDESKVGGIWWRAKNGIIGHEEFYQRFLNGELIYRPISDSEDGVVTRKVSDLKNPLDGTFDLSQCGRAGNHLLVTTDPSVFFARLGELIVVGVFLHCFAKKKIDTEAAPLKLIMDNWNGEAAPVGIFWRWGVWDNLEWYDYLTSASLVEISSKDLYENWNRSLSVLMPTNPRTPHHRHIGREWSGLRGPSKCCYIHLVNT